MSRVRVLGDCPAATELRACVRKDPDLELVDRQVAFTADMREGEHVSLNVGETVSDTELNVIRHLVELGLQPAILRGGSADENHIILTAPGVSAADAAHGVYRGLLDSAGHGQPRRAITAVPQAFAAGFMKALGSRWMLIALVAAALIAFLATHAHAQTAIQVRDATTGAPVNTGSSADHAERVVCVNPITHLLESCAGAGVGGGGTVAQGTPALTTDATAWPMKVVFGSAQIDPRAIRTLTTGDAVTASLAAGSVIRVQDGAGNTISSTASALWGVIRDAAGNARGANVNASNQLSVSVDNTPTVTATPPSDTVVIGTITSTTCPGTGCVEATVAGRSAVYFSVSGLGSGTVQVALSNDGGTTYPIYVPFFGVSGQQYSNVIGASGNGTYLVYPGGMNKMAVVQTSGTDTIPVRINLAVGVPPPLLGVATAQNQSSEISLLNDLPFLVQGQGQNTDPQAKAALVSGQRDDASTTTCSEDKVCYTRVNANRELLVNTADGSEVTLGSKADAKSTATDTTAVTAMQVLKEISAMEQAPASRAVTNAGTFPVQATLQAGSAIAGKVGIDQTTPGTTNGVQVNAALPAGTNLLGKTGIDQTSDGTTNKVYVGNIPHVVVDSGAITETNSAASKADLDTIVASTATVATNTRVRGTAASPAMVMATDQDTQLLAANASRVSWQVCNQSRSPMRVKFGSGATRFSYSVLVAANGCFSDGSYTGQVNAVWDVGADQFASVVESQ